MSMRNFKILLKLSFNGPVMAYQMQFMSRVFMNAQLDYCANAETGRIHVETTIFIHRYQSYERTKTSTELSRMMN